MQATAKTPEVTESQCPFQAERSGEVREVGGQAVWSLSSCKPGELIFTQMLGTFRLAEVFNLEMQQRTSVYWLSHLPRRQFHQQI